MKKAIILILILASLPIITKAQAGLDTLQLRTIFAEPYLAGKRPAFDTFYPDQKGIFFTWNDSAMAKDETFKVGFRRMKVEEVPDTLNTNYQVSPDRKSVVYSRNSDIWLADQNFRNAKKIISSKEQEYNPVWSPDGKRIAYVQDGDVWVTRVDHAGLSQVTDKESGDPGYNILGWTSNDRMVLEQYDRSDMKEYYFPEYMHKYVRPGETKRGIGEEVITVATLDSVHVDTLFAGKEYVNVDISKDGKYVALDRTGPPMKHRSIDVFDLDDMKSTTVFQDSTQGWIYGRDMKFAPEGHKLMFESEQSGWNHIYTVNPDGSGLKQWTHGEFEVPWVDWRSDKEMVFTSTEVGPGERQIYTLDLENGDIKKLTEEPGYRQHFHLSENKRYLVYEKSYFNVPFELYLMDLKHPRKEQRLTHSIPDRFNKIDWQREEYTRFTGRDGDTKISMSFLKPQHIQSGKQYPLIVFAHGAGSLQNVYKGWSDYYFREYMFNQFLTEHGYAVMQVDFRHSTGYGRKFREDVEGWMGKYETQDIEDGINQLAARSYVDTSRVGIYGGSYGGFMALYTVGTAPQYFDAAAALRAVTNWRNYYYTNPWYTQPRLGTPEKDPENYKRSSPLTYADSLSRPVLILHGLMDNNVGFQDAAEYIDRLIQTNNKHFQMMMYPSERHSFEDPDAWIDEYRRIYNFFNEKLKQPEKD